MGRPNFFLKKKIEEAKVHLNLLIIIRVTNCTIVDSQDKLYPLLHGFGLSVVTNLCFK
jgi:hypothetical protein